MSVQPVERAFRILESLSVSPAGVSEVAVRVELAKSTVSRLLTTREGIGAVDCVFRAIVPAPHRVEASV